MAELTTDCCGRCGCSTTVAGPSDQTDIRELVRQRYAVLADAAAAGASLSCGSRPRSRTCAPVRRCSISVRARGGDVLISARRVGPTGRAIGIDMTDEMLEIARANAVQAGATNVEFVKGYLEEMPVGDSTVDVVISNCVINLAADKRRVIREAARVLRSGGRFAVADVIADEDMDDATRADMQAWTGCIAGALTRREFEDVLVEAGFAEVEITETHRVHEHAGSAIVRARKPAA